MVDMATPVIIPCRNEGSTIGEIVSQFKSHKEVSDVIVGVDSVTTDDTVKEALKYGAWVYLTGVHGKSEVVNNALKHAREAKIIRSEMDRVILCDGDYTGLTHAHIDRMVNNKPGTVLIGVPDWPKIDVPEFVTKAWPHVSGFRNLPVYAIPHNSHGYLLETMINLFAIRSGMTIEHRFLDGLKSPFQWPMSERRFRAMVTDRQWGMEHGIFPIPAQSKAPES